MRSRRSFLTSIASLSLATGLAAGDGAPAFAQFTARDVFELEYGDDPQISPDGRSVAYVRRSMDVMTDRVRANLWLIDTASGEQRPLLSGRNSFSSPRWSPDGARLAYASAVEGSQQIYVRWMDTGQTALVSNLIEAPGSLAWSPDGRWIAFTMAVRTEAKPLATPPPKPEGAEWARPVTVIDRVVYRVDGAGYLPLAYTHLFLVPAEGGTPRQLTSGDFNHNGPLAWTPDGAALVFSANRSAGWEHESLESDLWSVALADGALTRLTSRTGLDASAEVSPDGQWIAYLGFDDQGLGHHTTRLHLMARDGSGARVLGGALDADIEEPKWSADSRTIFFAYDWRGEKRIGAASLDGAVTTLDLRLGGNDISRPYTSGAYSVSGDGTIAFTLARPDRPADIAIGGAGRETRVLTALNEDLFASRRLGAVRDIQWKSSADGREIQGWVVTPPDFDPAKKYPLILEIHGGPFAAYGPVFAAEIQRYAAEGYIVLYANPRGSTSYGETFANLIHHDYPGRDYDDLMSGVDAVIAEGHVDPAQLFVTGGSGGGVLTAWIVGKTGRFRAAAVIKPVINMTSFVLTADYNPHFYRYWFGKFPWEDPESYWKRSPLSLVGNVTTPTLVMVGEADHRTPPGEAEQYYQALRLRRVDTALVRVPDSPHDISARPSNLVAKVDNILAWFARHRGGTTNDDDTQK